MMQGFERFLNAGKERGRAQHVGAVVAQKEFTCARDFGIAHRISQRAPDQFRGAVAYVRVDPLVVERSQPDCEPRSVRGVGQVQTGIDQRTVKIEDHKQDAHAAPIFRFRMRPARAGGLRRARGRPVPNSYSTIFRCSVLRWMPSNLLAAVCLPPARSSAPWIILRSRIPTASCSRMLLLNRRSTSASNSFFIFVPYQLKEFYGRPFPACGSRRPKLPHRFYGSHLSIREEPLRRRSGRWMPRKEPGANSRWPAAERRPAQTPAPP